MCSQREHTLDELSAMTGVPSRTIRYWQAVGVLPPPARQGRVSRYDDGHLRRVRLISRLADQGIRLDTCRTLVDLLEGGSDSIREWLGLGGEEFAVEAPVASDDRRTRLPERDLAHLLDGRREVLQGLMRMGLARRNADGSWETPNRGLLALALRVDRLGIDGETAVGAYAMLRHHLRPLAEQLVAWFDTRLPPPDSARAGWARLGALRPIGADAARLILWEEIGLAFRRQVQGTRTVKREPVVPRWLRWVVGHNAERTAP